MAPLFGGDPPRKTGSLDSDLFFAPFSPHHTVFCFLIGHRNNGGICHSVGTFDPPETVFAKFSSVDCSLVQKGELSQISPFFKKVSWRGQFRGMQ